MLVRKAGEKNPTGSSRKTLLACVRLIPTAPARTDRRNTVVGGSSANACGETGNKQNGSKDDDREAVKRRHVWYRHRSACTLKPGCLSTGSEGVSQCCAPSCLNHQAMRLNRFYSWGTQQEVVLPWYAFAGSTTVVIQAT